MGGHGALYLSSKHELFCAAGSMSGAVDMNIMLNQKELNAPKRYLPAGTRFVFLTKYH
jgi:S-formylglutathione hydrolase FrmB